MSATGNKKSIELSFYDCPVPLNPLLVVVCDFEEFNVHKHHMFLPDLLKWKLIHSQLCKRQDNIITALIVFFSFHI